MARKERSGAPYGAWQGETPNQAQKCVETHQNACYYAFMTLLLQSDFCVYCGAPATTRDHVIPLSKEVTTDDNFEVPCCTACNSSVKARYFNSFEDKAKWLLHRATKANRVHWDRLQLIVPRVVEALSQRVVGKNSAALRAGRETSTCVTCGAIHSRQSHYCSQRCMKLDYQDQRRRKQPPRKSERRLVLEKWAAMPMPEMPEPILIGYRSFEAVLRRALGNGATQ
jgi:hypothetical protein